MKITVLAGGVGSARFLAGLIRVAEPADVTAIVNTADDEVIRGLHVSPDIDTVLYHLAGLQDWDRGWGIAGDTFRSNHRYTTLAAGLGSEAQAWFALGDADLATNLLRTQLLSRGRTLTEVVNILTTAMDIPCEVLPMTDETVSTKLTTVEGVRLDFQEYFVRRQQADSISAVDYEGADTATPAPGVVDALNEADVVIVGPSNPLLSVLPILSIPGIRDAVSGAIAVSPIVGGRALKGPADRLLAGLGHEVSPAGIASIYEGLIGLFVLDVVDADLAGKISCRTLVCDTIMRSPSEAARLAKEVLSAT